MEMVDGLKVKENLAKLRLDHAEAQKIVSEPFPQQAELDSKEERLKTLTDELNKAAAEAIESENATEETATEKPKRKSKINIDVDVE